MFKNLYYGWWIVLACFIINLYVGGVIYFSFTAFFEPIQHEFGWSYTLIWYGLCAISGVAIFLIMKMKPTASSQGTP